MTIEQWETILENENTELSKARLKRIPDIKERRDLKRGFQYSAITQSYKNYLLETLRENFSVQETLGARTKFYRESMELPKSHVNDASVIASCGQSFEPAESYILEKQLKGRRPAEYISPVKKGVPIVKREWEREKFGFRLWDRVLCEHPKLDDLIGYVTTLRSDGSCRVGDMKSSNIIAEELGLKDTSVSYKKLRLLMPSFSNYVREFVKVDNKTKAREQ